MQPFFIRAEGHDGAIILCAFCIGQRIGHIVQYDGFIADSDQQYGMVGIAGKVAHDGQLHLVGRKSGAF